MSTKTKTKTTAAPAAVPTLEELFTSPHFFGVTTATPLQVAITRICEGRPLLELAEHPDVLEAVGGPEAAALLAPGGARPREVDLLGGIRTGKSVLVAAHAWWTTQSVDMSHVRPGEIPRYPILSVNLRSAEATFSHLAGTIHARPLMRALLVGDVGADSLLVRTPSGKPVEICVAAGARAGANVISVFLTGVAFEEYPRQQSEAGGFVVNFDSQLQSASGRVLRGGQILSAGAPWGPVGSAFERFSAHFGKPTPERVIIRGTGPQLNPFWWTPEKCEAQQRSNAQAYTTDVLAQFADPSSSLIVQSDVRAAVRVGGPLVVPFKPNQGRSRIAAMDGASRRNAWTLVVVAGWTDAEGVARYEVELAKQWQGTSVQPLDPDLTLQRIAKIIAPYGLDFVCSDQHHADSYIALGARIGLRVMIHPMLGGNAPASSVGKPRTTAAVYKNDCYEALAAIFASRSIRIPDDRVFIADMLSIRRVNGRSTTYELPGDASGRHCDFVPALSLALSRFPAWGEARDEAAVERERQRVSRVVGDLLVARGDASASLLLQREQERHDARLSARLEAQSPAAVEREARAWEGRRDQRAPWRGPPGGGRGGGRKLW